MNINKVQLKTILFLTTLLFFSCKNKTTHKERATSQDTVAAPTVIRNNDVSLPKSKVDRAKYHTTSDTVYIYTQFNDTLKYSKNDFNDIIDNFPELYDETIDHPDSTYSKSKIWVELVDSSGNKNHLSFGSEVGQDQYYILYAYFLKHKNGIEQFVIRRKKLLEIYHALNSLFATLNYGGTYFGHQYARIEGYAEFSVYWFSRYKDYFDRPYDISKQKAFYIGGLKQLIIDEEKIDNNTIGKEAKAERKKELLKDVDKLDKLITDNFYLRMAKSFQAGHY